MSDLGLNPYFNGIYFLIRQKYIHRASEIGSLNPYFNGIYFLIKIYINIMENMENVLILILMEYTFS